MHKNSSFLVMEIDSPSLLFSKGQHSFKKRKKIAQLGSNTFPSNQNPKITRTGNNAHIMKEK